MSERINPVGDGFPSVRALVDEMHRFGASIVQIGAENDNSENDFLIVCIQGREEIADIKKAIAEVEEMWANLPEDE